MTPASAIKQAAKKIGVAVFGSLCLSFGAAAQSGAVAGGAAKTSVRKDTLRFYNIHTKQSTTVIRVKGEPVSDKVNWFMRDYRRNKKADMAPALFDLLGDLKAAINRRYPKLRVRFNVVSSFRTPETNASLRKAGGAQAEKSLHMSCEAMDIRVPGLKTKELRDIATCLERGGVGFYAEDGFVHVDIGRVRYWPSRDYLKTLKCSK